MDEVTRGMLTFENLDSHGLPALRWVCTWHYRLNDRSASSASVLRSLLDDEHYAYSFTAPFPSPTFSIGGPTVRGPYLLDHPTAAPSTRVSIEDA